jgi:hypothetical protein
MSVGTGTAIAIAVAAGTATAGAYAAHEQSNAAETAANQQTDASNDALHLTQQQYAQQREDLGPYRDIGVQSLGRLSELMGFAPYTGEPAKPADIKPTTTKVDGDLPKKKAEQYAGPTLGPGGMATMGNAQPATQPSAPNAGGQLVQVRAPDGSVGSVPINRLPDAIAAGGTRIN